MLITEFSVASKLTQFGKFWFNFVFNFYLNVFKVKKSNLQLSYRLKSVIKCTVS